MSKKFGPRHVRKPDTSQIEPHGPTVRMLVGAYKKKCSSFDQMLMQLNQVDDTRSIEEVEKDIAAKSMKLADLETKRRPRIDRVVLAHEIKTLQAVLPYKKQVEKLRLEIGTVRTRLNELEGQEKNVKIKLQLEEELGNLQRQLRALEKSETSKSELRDQVETTRRRLGFDLWSLWQYSDEFSKATIEYLEVTKKTLGIVPSMGKVIPRGMSGIGSR